jgi:hypothetical protein
MIVKYNVTGSARKQLVDIIGEILGRSPVYMGTPTFAYTVGEDTVSREGTLGFSAAGSCEEAGMLIAALKEHGYSGKATGAAAENIPDYLDLNMTEREELGLGRERRDPWGDDGMRASDIPEVESPNKLELMVSKDGFTDRAIENLRKIVAGKETLIKKALGADNLPIEEKGEKLCFPWFTLSDIDGEVDAYTRFVCALSDMAKKQKSVTAKERTSENDKFAMRLFLVRLGFVGPDYKATRRILLRNLSGNGSFKNGRPPAKAPDNAGNIAENTQNNENM